MKTHMIFILLAIVTIFTPSILSTTVSHDGRALLINGERKIILSGSIHYPRSTPEMWPDLIRKAKEGGLDAIETYVFWNAHEPVRRQYDFTGRNDLIRFLKTIKQAGLYAILRIGPYACAEWNYGGFPVWLHNLPGIQIRTDNKVFMDEMQTFTTLIVDMVKKENLLAPEGGPIILTQIENEYGNIMDPYGDAGKRYINWCAKMAVAQNVGVPWIMCQQSDAPQPMINTCNGWYCHDFTPNNPNSPKIWTENWTGWFKNWGGKLPHRTAEDVAYAVARFFQTGGTVQNYYMYHGGTNFGRTTGGPYITTSYDYDAPLDEYGNLNQPKWGHLKELHAVLHSIEKVLTYGDITKTDLGNNVTVTTYKTSVISSCFINNDNTSNDATITYNGKNFTIPAWSVSILPDCKNEVYNTAKVNTQTNIVAKIPNGAKKEPSALTWNWTRERIGKFAKGGKGDFAMDVLLEQKAVTNDSSDYLWYITTFHLEKNDPLLSNGDLKLNINSSAHVLHVYVNGHELGYEYVNTSAYVYTFEKKVNLRSGKNIIALLSATVGLKNYGSFYDLTPVGITGPVKLVGKQGAVLKDLSNHAWTYHTGLEGLDHDHLYSEKSLYVNKWRTSHGMPINTRMIWYKTTFKPPLGTDPVVVDLSGMGKGEAWVNGLSIGRYWPSYVSDNDGCTLEPCNYRGQYDNNKCLTNCGKPIQTEYHVPRSFLRSDVNTLVLFEELGGNPTGVNFKTVRAGGACANAYEGNLLALSCEGRPISGIKFASFGAPQGVCGSFEKGSCESANDAKSILTKACVGKEFCLLDVSEKTFGAASSCGDKTKRLAVELVC
ncbi:beta-galactosidase 15-like [Chenopodium quinoa]|uniref:Beta-galactosidase n=1 Tax=Chenopodium quinoa TaxID=63459 RepID=A0A803M8Q8_CHEQI|nr:beta-galactosidase 15-like [Chenopodium quinoa]